MFQLDRRHADNIDFGIIIAALLLMIIGVINLYSATHIGDSFINTRFLKQVIYICAGILTILITMFFNYMRLKKWAWIIYLLSVGLLFWVMVDGLTIGGSKRWIHLVFFNLQPSEFAKISIIIILSSYFFNKGILSGLTLLNMIKPFLLIIPLFFFVFIQPDLGTALLILVIAFAIFLYIGFTKKTFFTLTGILAIISTLGWFSLKAYQKTRILILFNPDMDPMGSGYHIRQSIIAVASGRIFGKGYLHGTQTRLNFLPEQHTDFIFSVLGEEWGLMGSLLVIGLYFLIIYRGIIIAKNANNRFGSLLAIGITTMLFCQIFVNIGMVTGILPVVGVPLPFLSYGGSSLITICIGIGLLLNINMRRFTFNKDI